MGVAHVACNGVCVCVYEEEEEKLNKFDKNKS